MKIVFFGTPYFAAEILKHLIQNNIQIVAVVTQVDKSHRYIPEVKKTALKLLPNTPIIQPEKASDLEFIESLKKFDADLFIVAAYGQILKESLLNIPKLASINIHASLLPKYRGANPIRSAILNGDTQTGITIMKMVKKMDAGDIILKKEVDINDDENFQSLEKKLIDLSKDLIIETIKLFKEKKVLYTPQDESEVSYSSKIKFEDRLIDWNNSAKDIFNKIRAFSLEPGAIAKIIIDNEEKNLKILKAQIVEIKLNPKETKIEKNSLIVGCKDKSLSVQILQLQDKRSCDIVSFINGLKKEILFI